jgi:hypothetical protein
VEIAPCDLEGQGIDIHQSHLDADPGEHGGQGSAGAADHQDVTGMFLQHQPEQGMDIFGEADTMAVSDALMVLCLPIGNSARAIVLGQYDFGGTLPLTGQARLASTARYRPRRNRK